MTRWSTDEVDRQHAVDYWRNVRRQAYVDVGTDPTTPEFHGEVTSGEYGTFALSTKHASGEHIRRGPRRLTHGDEDEDYLFAAFQISGTGMLQQAGRSAVVSPGAFALYDSSLPFELHYEGPYEQVVVRLPAERAYALAGLRRGTDLLAVPLDCKGAMSAVAAFFVNFAETQQRDPDGVEFLLPHASGLASTLLTYASSTQAPEAPEFLRHNEVTSFIRTHLADPDLDADTIATGVQMSRRSLYRLFEDTDTSVMSLLRSVRIDTAKDLLRDRGRPVSAVARETGFSNLSHFYRTFRSETGMTPGDFRELDGVARSA
ncbi:helix-turn-helix domain-containing protein [Pseudonocardia phyllosphaerae]|uniref:helix-turn-helix domain-containing protein n=1 Tax=Pseudonocardia phyllosphaerae TaxID=3390502 RepID=UPI00397A2F83